MFFILSKILAFLLSPLTWILTVLLLALVKKNPVAKRNLFLTGTGLLIFFTNPFIVDECMRQWEITTPDLQSKRKFKYGIVLGGMIWYDARQDRPQFMRGADRLFQALPLLQRGQVQKIIISGGSGSILHQEEKESLILKNYLVRIGIPDSIILTETTSRNTHENAVETKRILDSLNVKDSVLFITSAFHLRRALECFHREGITKLVAYPTDRYSGPRKWDFEYLFRPTINALDEWELLLHEWTGWITYKIKGYI